MSHMSQASQVVPHHNYSISLETIPFFLALFLTANVHTLVAAVSGGVFELNDYCIVLSLLPRSRVLLSQAPSCLHPSFRFFAFSPRPMPDRGHLVSYILQLGPNGRCIFRCSRRAPVFPILSPFPFHILTADVSNVEGGGFCISSTSII